MLSESSVVLEEYDSFAEQYNALRGKKGNQQVWPARTDFSLVIGGRCTFQKRRPLTRAVVPQSNQKQITSFIAPKAAAAVAPAAAASAAAPLRVETNSTSSADIMLGKQGALLLYYYFMECGPLCSRCSMQR